MVFLPTASAIVPNAPEITAAFVSAAASSLFLSCSLDCLSNKSNSACVAFLSTNFCLSSSLICWYLFSCSWNDKLPDSISKPNKAAYWSLALCIFLLVITDNALLTSCADVIWFINSCCVFFANSSFLFFCNSAAFLVSSSW